MKLYKHLHQHCQQIQHRGSNYILHLKFRLHHLQYAITNNLLSELYRSQIPILFLPLQIELLLHGYFL